MSARGLYGAERVLVNLVNHLDSRYFSTITVILWNHNEPAYEVINEINFHGNKYIIIECKRWIDIACIIRILECIHKYRIDILHCHEMKSRLYGLIAAFITNVHHITTHNNWIRAGGLVSLFEFLDALYIRFFETIVAVSEDLSNVLRKLRVDPERIKTIRNGVDLPRAAPGNVELAELRSSLGINDSCRIVGMVGRISVEKGPRYFIEAARKVLKTRSDVRFIMVGDGPLRTQMEGYSKRLGLSDKLIFAGFRPHVASFYHLMDVCVMPSLREGTPMVLLEAMAQGLPVIASRVGGVPNIITHCQNGILVSPGQPDELAAQILLLLDDADYASRISINAQKTVRDTFSVERMVSQYEDEYRRLCSNPSRQANSAM